MKPDTREKAVLQGSPENKDRRRGDDEPTGTVCVMEEEIKEHADDPPKASRSDEKPSDEQEEFAKLDRNHDGVVHLMEADMIAEAVQRDDEKEVSSGGKGDGVFHVMEAQMKGEAIKDDPDRDRIDNTLPGPEDGAGDGEGLDKPPPGEEGPPLGGSRGAPGRSRR